MDEWIKHTHNSENYDFDLIWWRIFHEKNGLNLSDFEKKIPKTLIARFLW